MNWVKVFYREAKR